MHTWLCTPICSRVHTGKSFSHSVSIYLSFTVIFVFSLKIHIMALRISFIVYLGDVPYKYRSVLPG